MPEYSKMCTTVAGCVFLNSSVILFHSGDSRVYRHDKWGLVKMTVDHSAVQQLIDMGQLTEEELDELILRCADIIEAVKMRQKGGKQYSA